MEFTFKASMMKEWTVTEDRILWGKKEIFYKDITRFEHSPVKGLNANGLVQIWIPGKAMNISLCYPKKQKEEAERAVAFIYERLPEQLRPKAPKEYRKKCNVCGHVFCYTDKDVEESERNKTLAKMHSFTASVNAVGGTAYNMYEQDKQAAAAKAQVRDFTKCPNCSSSDLSDLEDAPVATEKPAASNLDELKQLKELLDSGIITEEEFAAKKKQILGL